MPREARKNSFSSSKIYHVILKGINSQEIFFEDSDRRFFLNQIQKTKEIYQYDIYAYVLMDNHIHLLIYDKETNLSEIVHRICTIYAMYFNRKYKRIGHLFQNRFKSKCVESERYLLSLQRYIHKNPQKDEICLMNKYKWSSYQEYINKPIVANTNFILNIFDSNNTKAIKKFIEYNKVNMEKNEIIEFEMKDNLTDEDVVEIIKSNLKIDNIMMIQNFNKKIRDNCIKEIFKIKGISKKQIARITGISSRTIQRAITGK